MTRFIKVSCILFIILLFQTLEYGHIWAQEWNSARITLLQGSNIPVVFNNLQQYRKGIEMTNISRLGITLVDNNIAGHALNGFQLNFRSFNMQSTIQGEVHTLSLDKIRVKADNALGLEAGESQGYVSLSSGWQTLFTYENLSWTDLHWNTHQLHISYDFGKPVDMGGNGSMLGEPTDYYSVEIEFEIIPVGPGF